MSDNPSMIGRKYVSDEETWKPDRRDGQISAQ